MRPRALPACALLCLVAGVSGTGCGQASHPASATAPQAALIRTRGELARARSVVKPYADAFNAALKHSPLPLSLTVYGGYDSCRTGQHRVDYVYTVNVRATVPATMSQLSTEVTTLLRVEGWQVVSVDFAKAHLHFASTNHPLYQMRQRGMKGAANILPYGSDSAGAVVFMHSPCVDTGSFAVKVEPGGEVSVQAARSG